MNGFVLEYENKNFPLLEVQLGETTAKIDPTKKLMSLWEFQTTEECHKIIDGLQELRKKGNV